MRRWERLTILAILAWVFWAIYGLIFNHSYIDEAKYLIKGWLILSKQVGYYSSYGFFYQHMPGSLLWFGLGQKIFGPSLLTGRVQSFFLSGVTLILCFKLARTLAGQKAGSLALILMGLSPVAIFYYSSATPESLIVSLLLAGLIAFYHALNSKHQWRFIWATLCFSLAFIVRENFLVVLIYYLIFLIIQQRRNWQILSLNFLILFIVLGVFILPGYPGTIKILKNFPGISLWLPVSQAEQEVLNLNWLQDLHNRSLYLLAIYQFITSYLILVITGVLASGLTLKRIISKQQELKKIRNREFWLFLVGLAGLIFTAHFWSAWHLSPRAIVGYFAFVAPIVAVIIASLLVKLKSNWFKTPLKITIAAGFCLLIVPFELRGGSIFSLPKTTPDLILINQSAQALKPIVKNKKQIIWLSEPISLYLAGKISFYPLINHTNSFKPSEMTETVEALGFWNQAMMRNWLSQADLVVIDKNRLNLLKQSPQANKVAVLLESEINDNWQQLEVEKYIWPGHLFFFNRNN
jgi:4-amino-4-deoxy-L-arabinose transferase-like glycosyltransferase